MAIGLALALAYVGRQPLRPQPPSQPMSSSSATFRLLLLVYLVFYGLPTVVDIRYDATTSFVATLSLYGGAYLVEVFRAGLAGGPAGTDRRRQGDRTHARCSASSMSACRPRCASALPALSNTYVSLFKDTSIASVIAVPELAYGAQWINLNTFRIVEVYAVVTPMYLVTGYGILFALRLLERRFAIAR